MREVQSIQVANSGGEFELLHGEKEPGRARWRISMRSGPMPNALARTKPSGVRIPPESQPPEETARNVPFEQESHRSKARPRRSDWMREENCNEEIWDYAGMFSYSLGGDDHCGVRETIP